MSRDITVYDVQTAIATIRSWASGDSYMPDCISVGVLYSMAELLESLLIDAQQTESMRTEKCQNCQVLISALHSAANALECITVGEHIDSASTLAMVRHALSQYSKENNERI